MKVRQAGIDCTPVCAIVGGKKDTTPPSPGKEISAACSVGAHRKGGNPGSRQAGRSPACAVVGREKKAAFSRGKEISATCPVGAHRKVRNICGRQAGIDCTPVCAVVGGKKDTAVICPGKKIRAGDGEGINFAAVGSVGLYPLGIQRVHSGEYRKHHKEESESVCHLFLPS